MTSDMAEDQMPAGAVDIESERRRGRQERRGLSERQASGLASGLDEDSLGIVEPRILVLRGGAGGRSSPSRIASEYGLFTRGEAGYGWVSNGRFRSRQDRWGYSADWLTTLFPAVPPPPVEPKAVESKWPAEARRWPAALLHGEALRGVKDGLRIELRCAVVRRPLERAFQPPATR